VLKKDGLDGALLDGRGLLKAVGVDTAEKVLLEVHGIEASGGLLPIGGDFDPICADFGGTTRRGGRKRGENGSVQHLRRD